MCNNGGDGGYYHGMGKKIYKVFHPVVARDKVFYGSVADGRHALHIPDADMDADYPGYHKRCFDLYIILNYIQSHYDGNTGQNKEFLLRMLINLFCNEQDRSCLEWFTNILSCRMVSPVPISLNIVYGNGVKSFERDPGPINIIIPKTTRNIDVMEKIFDRFYKKDWIKYQDGNFILDMDIVGFTLWMLNREEESLQKTNPQCWDKWGRFRLEKTLVYKKGLWQKPVVDILLMEMIRRIEDESGIELLKKAPWGNRAKAVWLTHDVDKLAGKYALSLRMLGWMGLATRELIKGNKIGFLKWMKKCKDWWLAEDDPTFESMRKLMDTNGRVNAKSTFFFMSLARGVSFKEGIRYPIGHRRMPEILNEIEAGGFSIGLHPGFDKADDAEYLLSQKTELQRVAKRDILFVRNHYLRVSYPDAWLIEENAGFKISSNVGWTSQDGFRAGTCWPYQPFDMINDKPFNIVEVPLIYMDTKVDDEQTMIQDALLLSNEVAEVHGIFTINFHTTLFDKFEMDNKGNAYNRLLDIFSQQDWHFIESGDILKTGFH